MFPGQVANANQVPRGVSGGTTPAGTNITIGGINYKYHRFTSSNTFTIAKGIITNARYLLIGGGGSGGEISSVANTFAVATRGGSGGGFLEVSNQTLLAGNYPVTIGAGGTGLSAGNTTSFDTSNAYGGGSGGGRINTSYYSDPALTGSKNNGFLLMSSSNGIAILTQTYNASSVTCDIISQGRTGTNNQLSSNGGVYLLASAGGAGAGGCQTNISVDASTGYARGGDGGAGLSSDIISSSLTFSGGGGGAHVRSNVNGTTSGASPSVPAPASNTTGSDGGGDGGSEPSSGAYTGTPDPDFGHGEANRGGGGGGTSGRRAWNGSTGGSAYGGNGGSGVFIIRYPV